MSGADDALGSALDFISRIAHGLDDGDVMPALDRVVREINPLLGVAGTGVLLLGEDLILRSAVASDERASILGKVQERTGTGPSIDAFNEDRAVATTDLARDDKWPDAADLVVYGVRSVLAVPIRLVVGPIGALHTYGTEANNWPPDATDRLQAWAAAIAELLRSAAQTRATEVTVAQLQYALDRRVVIERAKGVLMAREHIAADAAFERLRLTARNQRRPVLDVARETLEEVVGRPGPPNPPKMKTNGKGKRPDGLGTDDSAVRDRRRARRST